MSRAMSSSGSESLTSALLRGITTILRRFRSPPSQKVDLLQRARRVKQCENLGLVIPVNSRKGLPPSSGGPLIHPPTTGNRGPPECSRAFSVDLRRISRYLSVAFPCMKIYLSLHHRTIILVDTNCRPFSTDGLFPAPIYLLSTEKES